MPKIDLEAAPSFVRYDQATISESDRPDVREEAGDYGAGILSNVALITQGEALGHDMWIDSAMLDQVAGGASEAGVKARFTHPTMSSDGLGRTLGRVKSLRREGDKVLGDLHFFESAHATPEGDLAEYVMMLANEDPTAAGLSIVFDTDAEATDDHYNEFTVDGSFASPDESNEKNLPHARVAKLRAADVVDEPAANPDGLFHRQSVSADAGSFLEYCVGLSDDKPQASFGVDSDRAKAFFQRWLNEQELQISSSKVPEMPQENQGDQTDTRQEMLDEHKKFTEAYGVENGTEWFHDGLTYEDAMFHHVEIVEAKLAAAIAEVAALTAKFKEVSFGETEPIETAGTQPTDTKVSYESMFNIRNN